MSRTLVLAVIPFLVLACGDDKEDTSLPEDTGPFETCTAASLDEGSTGTYVVNAGGDDHVKHHWYMPEGIDHIRATATWTADVAWLLEYAGGIGWCPHSGTTIGDAVEGDTGEIVLDLYPVDVDDTSPTFTPTERVSTTRWTCNSARARPQSRFRSHRSSVSSSEPLPMPGGSRLKRVPWGGLGCVWRKRGSPWCSGTTSAAVECLGGSPALVGGTPSTRFPCSPCTIGIPPSLIPRPTPESWREPAMCPLATHPF